MPAMKSTGPMKDNYVSGLEKAVASKVEWRDKRVKPYAIKSPEFRANLSGAKRFVAANPTPKGRVVVNRSGDVSIHGYGRRQDSRARGGM